VAVVVVLVEESGAREFESGAREFVGGAGRSVFFVVCGDGLVGGGGGGRVVRGVRRGGGGGGSESVVGGRVREEDEFFGDGEGFACFLVEVAAYIALGPSDEVVGFGLFFCR